jgi:Peptide N-acetyl-beta-D-glucosaminyl asparaginase amidase A
VQSLEDQDMLPLLKSSHGLALKSLSITSFGVLAYCGSPRTAMEQTEQASAIPTASAAASTSSMVMPTAMHASLAGTVSASALPVDQAGADPLTVEPRVPNAAGAPCVVELFRNANFTRNDSSIQPIVYVPPPACVGPWSKVKLVLDLSGPRPPRPRVANIELLFDSTMAEGQIEGAIRAGAVFIGAPQENAQLPVWRLERDLTEYAALLTKPQVAFLLMQSDNEYHDFEDPLSVFARSGKLVFYPATAQTPAQRRADAIYGFNDFSPGNNDWPGYVYPRNIERAYLDVTARALGGPNRFWYACVPQAAADTYPQLLSVFAIGDARGNYIGREGCTGGSYREIEIRIDGQLAGLAPIYPWLPSTIHSNFGDTIDDPAPSVQALNMMPYRVDLTPFAGLLSNGSPHRVEAFLASGEPVDSWNGYFRGQLLLYLDHGRAQVTGAVTRNTLAAQPSTPIVQNGLALSGETLQGNIVTTLQRQYTIEGYVDTSHGRIRSSVWQNSRFANTQSFVIIGPPPHGSTEYHHDFLNKIRLSSTVDSISRRMLGSTVLSDDREYRTYPLIMDFHHGGEFIVMDEFGGPASEFFSVTVHQARGIRASHFRTGMARYDTRLADVFDGSHAWLRDVGDSNWYGRRRYLFTDTFGSCYSAALTTANAELMTRTRGTECPNGNAIRWYAHPDGSPDGLGWAHQPW